MNGSAFRTIGIGIASGMVAAYVMEHAQTLLKKGHEQTGDKLGPSGDAPSSEKAADLASEIVTGRLLPENRKSEGGRIAHYTTGAALGVIYGVLLRRSAAVSSGFGLPFGLAVSLFLDETIVPALGLSPPPTKTSLASHQDGWAAHAVFGMSLEASRRILNRVTA